MRANADGPQPGDGLPIPTPPVRDPVDGADEAANPTPVRGGRLDGYKNAYFYNVWGPPGLPLRTPLHGPGIDPQGQGTRSPGHPAKIPGSTQNPPLYATDI